MVLLTLGGANCVGGGNVEGGFKTLGGCPCGGTVVGGGIDGGFNDGGVYLMVGHVCAVEPTPTREGSRWRRLYTWLLISNLLLCFNGCFTKFFAAAFVHASRTALAVEWDEVEREVPFAYHSGQPPPICIATFA